MSEKELDEGPLSDASASCDEHKGEVTGLPLEYLLGDGASTQHFFNLRAEETLSSLEGSELHPAPVASSTALDETSDLKQKRDKLKLNIDHDADKSTGLIFSPGGSEAYVFARGGAESGAACKTPPRKLDENVFLEFTSPRGATAVVPHGERPKTVGQSDDSPRMVVASKINRNVLQGRLEDLRTSLEFALGSDELSSAQQSSEPSPRRFLPAVPPGVSELDDNESMTSPSVTRRGAMSPSMASVTSGSTTASGPTEGLRRRNLEWDSGADLGYEGIVARQKEAAASLSTLEKLAIGNYSSFLRTEPEGKPTARSIAANLGRGQQLLNRLPGGQDHEEDLRQMRLHKFADSLIKQRQIQLNAAKAASVSGGGPKVPATFQQKQANFKSKSDTSPDVSPVRRKLKKKHASSLKQSPGKASSLTDLTHDLALKPFMKQQNQISSRHSTSDLSPRSFSNSHSSQSSTGTVVHHKAPQDTEDDEEEIDPRFLEALSTDPSSLPVDLYAIMGQASSSQPSKSASNLKRNQQSQTSLNSRQSVETVITLEQLMARHKKLAAHRGSSRRMQESDSLDTDEEIQQIRHQERMSAYFETRNDAEGSEAHSDQAQLKPPVRQNWLFDTTDSRAQSLPPMSKEHRTSKPPPPDTASEDERHKEKQRSGTLDSAPIDRAKSFEYFPGESFPLQENSSSYEYLPGHMIHDTRPPTVVSNRPQGGSSSSNISPTTSPSAQSTSSNAVVSSSKKRGPRSRNQLFNDLARLSSQLMERTNHLHSAHVHQTMTFYSRLKDYISFLSMPSLSPSDARLKQQMADKILDLMKMEEEKLAEPRPLSTLLGMRPDFLDADEDPGTDAPTTKKIGDATADEADDGHDATNATNTTMKDEEAAIPGLLLDSAGSDILIQKLRISQMKKLRKEIRKLEKLEKVRLMKALSTNKDSPSPMNEQDIRNQINAKSDDSSLSSSFSSSVAPTPKSRGIEGKSASGSDTAKQKKQQVPSKRKPSVASVKEFCPPNAAGKKVTHDSDSTHFLAKNFQEKLALLNKEGTSAADFGQTYPTPRDEATEKLEEEKKATSIHRSSNNHEKRRQKKQQQQHQALAYYLSMDSSSPIQVGTKILREKRRVREENSIGKENRNILANYLSAIDSHPIAVRPKTAPAQSSSVDDDGTNSRNTASAGLKQQLTLQEALYLRKPGFVERSSLRAQFLKQKRDQRIEYNERYNKWCEEVAKTPALARPLLASPPPMPKMPRLFSYREMVRQAREKYQKLPEIMYGKTELKRKSSYRTNRLKAEMYKKKLQGKVLQGKVSLSHYNQILQS